MKSHTSLNWERIWTLKQDLWVSSASLHHQTICFHLAALLSGHTTDKVQIKCYYCYYLFLISVVFCLSVCVGQWWFYLYSLSGGEEGDGRAACKGECLTCHQYMLYLVVVSVTELVVSRCYFKTDQDHKCLMFITINCWCIVWFVY